MQKTDLLKSQRQKQNKIYLTTKFIISYLNCTKLKNGTRKICNKYVSQRAFKELIDWFDSYMFYYDLDDDMFHGNHEDCTNADFWYEFILRFNSFYREVNGG